MLKLFPGVKEYQVVLLKEGLGNKGADEEFPRREFQANLKGLVPLRIQFRRRVNCLVTRRAGAKVVGWSIVTTPLKSI